MDVNLERTRRVVAIACERPEALLCIVGPTASGKTELAVRLAEQLDGEIVSVDSVQIYRGFDIGSGKPTAEENARARHHLVDVADPLEPFDAARFAEAAHGAIAEIRARGKRPILCGGTFLWTKAVLHGLAEAPAADPEIRRRHRALAEEQGAAALHALLKGVDAPSAERLHPNDIVRVSRALEVFELSGEPMSSWQARHAFKEERYPAELVAIAHDQAALTERILARARGWLASGWIEEVRGLLDRGFGEARAMTSVGYREVYAHAKGELPRGDLERAVVRATRVFARRQRTWLNHAKVTVLE